MARDEALFRSALSKSSPPTLRLYTWSRPSVSIGYRQSINEACDVDECRRLGIDTVRRVSGGRAVLHHHELTYCLTASAEGSFRGLSVRGIYDWVSSAIRAALEAMAVTVDPPERSGTRRKPREPSQVLPCFAVPTGHEITAGGKKLVGSAQKWSRRGFLQHGSILLTIDSRLWRRATGLGREDQLQAVGLDTLAGKKIALGDLVEAIQEQFGQIFGETGRPSSLSHEEEETAKALAREKYASDSWNVSRQIGDTL